MKTLLYRGKDLANNAEALECVLACVNEAVRATNDALQKSGISFRDPMWTRDDIIARGSYFTVLYDAGDNPVAACEHVTVKDVLHIKSFGVVRKYQHMGYGKALMKAMVTYADENVLSEMRLMCAFNNEAAVALYRACGFKIFTCAMYRKV